MLKKFLKQKYVVDYAMNGKDGFILFNGNNYDLIITDMDMPFMNGNEMISKIREINKDIPIIMITGKGKPELGNNIPVIYKPFDLSELKQVMEKIS